MKFEGIYTPAITPLAGDGSIDKQAFADVLEYLIVAKVHGVIIGGSTSEYYSHTPQERFELASFAKEVMGSRMPLIVGTGAIRTEDSIEYAKAAKAIGADAILVSLPPYALPTEEETASPAPATDRAAGLPAMLYNYPGRTSTMMGRTLFETVTSKSKNFVAIKESSGSTGQLHLLARSFPSIALSCGWDDQALEFFAWNARSWVCAGSNFLPAEHIALYEACVMKKDFDEGLRIMSAMMPLMDFLEDAGKFVRSIKQGCEFAGLKTGGLRSPLQPLNEEQKQNLQRIVSALKEEVKSVTSGKA